MNFDSLFSDVDKMSTKYRSLLLLLKYDLNEDRQKMYISIAQVMKSCLRVSSLISTETIPNI